MQDRAAPTEGLLTAEQAGLRLGKRPRTVYDMMDKGTLGCVRLGRRGVRTTEAFLADYTRRAVVAQTPRPPRGERNQLGGDGWGALAGLTQGPGARELAEAIVREGPPQARDRMERLLPRAWAYLLALPEAIACERVEAFVSDLARVTRRWGRLTAGAAAVVAALGPQGPLGPLGFG